MLNESSYLIVPLTDACQIDWKLAEAFKFVEEPRRLNFEEAKSLEVTSEAFTDQVITPMHRDTDQKYVVLEVDYSRTAESPFPSHKHATYREHVEVEYGVQICNPQHPLLEVKGIGKNLELLFPGAGKSGKQKKYERDSVTEHYIPELVHNFKFPAVLWLKALLLPSICHRLHYLLLAEELRRWLITEKIDKGLGQQTFMLDVDYGDYDMREKMLQERNREEESYGKLDDFMNYLESTRNSNQAKRSRALMLLWKREELPTDIDRNWLEITEVDIDAYCNFLKKNQNQIHSANIREMLELQKPRTNFLKDKVERAEITLLKEQRCRNIQQKDLIKVLTTSNAGDVFDMEVSSIFVKLFRSHIFFSPSTEI